MESVLNPLINKKLFIKKHIEKLLLNKTNLKVELLQITNKINSCQIKINNCNDPKVRLDLMKKEINPLLKRKKELEKLLKGNDKNKKKVNSLKGQIELLRHERTEAKKEHEQKFKENEKLLDAYKKDYRQRLKVIQKERNRKSSLASKIKNLKSRAKQNKDIRITYIFLKGKLDKELKEFRDNCNKRKYYKEQKEIVKGFNSKINEIENRIRKVKKS